MFKHWYLGISGKRKPTKGYLQMKAASFQHYLRVFLSLSRRLPFQGVSYEPIFSPEAVLESQASQTRKPYRSSSAEETSSKGHLYL